MTFWDFTDNSNKGLIYPYIFLYLIIILIYRKIYFHLYTIGKENFIMNKKKKNIMNNIIMKKSKYR